MRWIGLVVLLLLVVGGVGALIVLRGDDDETTRTATETQAVASEPGTVEMPELLGAAYVDAVDQALAAGLFANSFPAESEQGRGTVVGQHPRAGTQLAPGATIRIDVSRGLGPEVERQVPDLTGLELPDALRACAQAGFTCRAVGGPGLVVRAARPLPGGSTELAQIELAMG